MNSAGSVSRPERLTAAHDLSAFVSREPALNAWLVHDAVRNEGRTARTFVVCAPGTSTVIGFYALANGAVQRAAATKKLQRNAPDPIPVMVLGRLAVASSWERRGLGHALLRDAVLRTLQASEIAGIAAILVHAKSADAAAFYQASGFEPSPLQPGTLMLSLRAISLSDDGR